MITFLVLKILGITVDFFPIPIDCTRFNVADPLRSLRPAMLFELGEAAIISDDPTKASKIQIARFKNIFVDNFYLRH